MKRKAIPENVGCNRVTDRATQQLEQQNYIIFT